MALDSICAARSTLLLKTREARRGLADGAITKLSKKAENNWAKREDGAGRQHVVLARSESWLARRFNAWFNRLDWKIQKSEMRNAVAELVAKSPEPERIRVSKVGRKFQIVVSFSSAPPISLVLPSDKLPVAALRRLWRVGEEPVDIPVALLPRVWGKLANREPDIVWPLAERQADAVAQRLVPTEIKVARDGRGSCRVEISFGGQTFTLKHWPLKRFRFPRAAFDVSGNRVLPDYLRPVLWFLAREPVVLKRLAQWEQEAPASPPQP
jgi:hypothetical protein